jgi:outer membrane receptor protein involved in Fe transport
MRFRRLSPRRLLLVLAVAGLFPWGPAAAQQARTVVVTGRVRTPAGKAVPAASVALFDSAAAAPPDSAPTAPPLARTATDSTGRFTLRVRPGRYALRITFLSYEPYGRSLRLRPGQKASLGTITLQPSAISLPGISVRARKSQMQLGFEKRVFRVGQDLTSMGGSVLDLLNDIPSLMTDFSGTISLRGSSAVRVLINGKPSSVYKNGSKALQSLPADMIEEVEVITNPSARYSAEGSAGIINIILKKKRRVGLHGTLGLMQRAPEASQASADLNYRRGAVNWYFNGSIARNEDPSHSRTYQRFESPDTAYLYHSFDNGNETDWHGDFEAGADVHLSAGQTLTPSALWHFEDKKDIWHGAYIDSTPGGAFLDRVNRGETIGGGEGEAELSLDYANHLGGDRHQLTVSATYTHGSHDELPRIQEAAPRPPYDSLYTAIDDRNRSHGFRFQADYVYPVADSGKVEAGVRSDHSWQHNLYTARERGAGEPWTSLPAFNSNFSVDDHVNAAYMTLFSKWSRLSYELGLRAEDYRIRTTLDTTAATTRQSYLDFFPTASLTWAFTDRRSVQLSYSRRISRPDPRLLLPRTDYSSSRSRFSGNPDLKPEYGNSYEAAFLQKWDAGSLLGSVYYRHGTGVIRQVARLDSAGVLRTVPINLATSDAWGVELTADEELGDRLKLSGSANLYRTRSRGRYAGTLYRTTTNRLTSRVQLQWQIVSGLRWQTAVRYYGPEKTIQGRRSSTTFVNMALAGDFLDHRATVSLSSEDLLSTRRDLYTITDPNAFSRIRRWEPSGVRLSVTYRIGPQGEEGDGGE